MIPLTAPFFTAGKDNVYVLNASCRANKEHEFWVLTGTHNTQYGVWRELHYFLLVT